ncbi:MAG: glycosyltransferase [Bacteriovoracaceae bacterium]|nr:glycosyltransferase [Bacteriovoracaceae bacterium]
MLLTIVTVVFNAEKELLKTLKSLSEQSVKNFEYIIIDGGSLDGTLDILDHFNDLHPIVISESDKGIYDAMNKGVRLANGRYLFFLNAGDVFDSKETVSKLIKILKLSEADFVHGSIRVDYDEVISYRPPFEIENLWKSHNFCHQGILIKTDYHKNNLYDIGYRIAADFKLTFDGLKSGATFKKVNFPFTKVLPGGVSDTDRSLSYAEKYSIVSKHDKSYLVYVYYHLKIVDSIVRLFLKKRLPKNLVSLIFRFKYRK